MVERITGITKGQFLKAADLFTSVRKDGDMKKVATIMYAVGWTQHTFARRLSALPQFCSCCWATSGEPVRRQRPSRHSNIQGATDMAACSTRARLPEGAEPNRCHLAAWLKRITPTGLQARSLDSFNYYSNTPKFCRLLFEGSIRRRRDQENDFAFPLHAQGGSQLLVDADLDNMYRGSVRGCWPFGMNGVAIGPDSQKNIDALKEGGISGGGRFIRRRLASSKSPVLHRGNEDHQHHGVSPALRWLR